MQQLQAADGRSDPDSEPATPDEGDHVDRVLAQWAREEPELDLSDTVAVIARLGRVRAYIDRELDELFGRYGLTRQSWDVLACLRRAGKPYRLTPTEINKRSCAPRAPSPHAARPGVRRADQAHSQPGGRPQLTRAASPRPAGRRLLRRVGPEHLANERRMLAPLTPDELTSLASLLRKLLVAFERDNPYPHSPANRRTRMARSTRPQS